MLLHVSLSIRSNFKPDLIFSCTHNTVVTFVHIVNNFKPTVAFVFIINEVKSHLMVKLSSIVDKNDNCLQNEPKFEQNLFNMNFTQYRVNAMPNGVKTERLDHVFLGGSKKLHNSGHNNTVESNFTALKNMF